MAPSNTPNEASHSPLSSGVSSAQEESSWESVTEGSNDEWDGILDYLSQNYPFGGGELTEDLYSIGFGGGGYRDTCTVWLCRDQQKGAWVALRVVIGKISVVDPYKTIKDGLQGVQQNDIRAAHIILPTDEFFVDGHGEDRHYCAVFPFFGPPLTHIRSILDGAPDLQERLLGFCHQAVEAMCFLHKHGICHGGKSCLCTSATSH